MAREQFESVDFVALQNVQVELNEGPYEGRYQTYIDGVDRSQLHVRVPVSDQLYLPLEEGTMITFKCLKQSGTYECRINIDQRRDMGAYPTLTIPRPAKMKKIQKRKDVRVPCDVQAKLWELEEESNSIKRGPLTVRIVDISAGGMRIQSSEKLDEGREVVLNFTLPLIDRTFETIFARTLRVFDEKVGDQFQTALKFSGLTSAQEDQIIRFAYQRQIKLKREGKWGND